MLAAISFLFIILIKTFQYYVSVMQKYMVIGSTKEDINKSR